MKEYKIPKETMLELMETEVKKQVEEACKMLPTKLKVDRLEWTEEGITVWLEN